MTANPLFKKLEDKTILVTGGAGFIGSNLINELLKHSCRVICFDDLSTGSPANLSDFSDHRNFIFIKGNVNNFGEIKKVFEENKIDYVFHYAARVGVIRTIEKPLEVLEDIEGIKNILKLSLEHQAGKVVFSSSSEVYGEPVQFPEREDGHLNPKLPYAVVKLVGENFLKSYYHTYGLKTCSLRFFNAYGPKQDSSSYGFVTGVFIRQALKGEPLTVFGDGSQTRDFVFIEDVIDAYMKAIERPSSGLVLNVGSGSDVSVKEVASLIHRLIKSKNKLLFGKKRKEQFETDICWKADTAAIKKALNWKAETSLISGLKKTIEWFSQNMELYGKKKQGNN